MATMKIGAGLDKFIAMSNELKYRVSGLSGRALYQGAKILADATRSEIEALPVASSKRVRRGERRNPTQVEKDGLLEGLGVARKRTDGGTSNITIGFDGWNADKTERWPGGKPNALIARSINKGTSFMRPIPFAKRAVTKARGEAEEAMKKEFEKQLSEIIGDG